MNYHVGEGNWIIIDGWLEYSQITKRNSRNIYILYIHGHNNLGFGRESTSDVNFTWSLKKDR